MLGPITQASLLALLLYWFRVKRDFSWKRLSFESLSCAECWTCGWITNACDTDDCSGSIATVQVDWQRVHVH